MRVKDGHGQRISRLSAGFPRWKMRIRPHLTGTHPTLSGETHDAVSKDR